MARLFFYIFTMVLLTGCSDGEGRLQQGDLLFQAAGKSDFCDAIMQATGGAGDIDLVHVGIFACINGDSVVIEASSESGVVMTPLADFISSCGTLDGKPAVVAMRVVSKHVSADRAVERAVACIGMPYDWEFATDNGKMYCSELVQHCFVKSDGEYLFGSVPMNFESADGSMPQFWVELFDKLGKPIPQGAPGTNPNSIYSSPQLILVKKYF